MQLVLPLIALLATSALASSLGAAPPQFIPKPTARQLEWTEMEIAALIHFNMASTKNCSEPDAFSPDKLDTDQWVESFEAFGAREAVLVAKHACGFCTWPTNATLPDGSRYPYSVAFSSWREGKGDVVSSFLSSVTKAGLGAGYYYSLGAGQLQHSLTNNDKHNLTKPEVRAIHEQQLTGAIFLLLFDCSYTDFRLILTELWSTYGNNGNLSEVWFDGGIGQPGGPMQQIVPRIAT